MAKITEEGVIRVLDHHIWKSVPKLMKEMGRRFLVSGTLYPILYRLEFSGDVESRWREGPWPRTREYKLTLQGIGRRAEITQKESTPSRLGELGLAET